MFLLLSVLVACSEGGSIDVKDTADAPEDTGADTGGTSAEDADNDGYLARVDCDDADANVHPGAEEVWYDGTDQDCDGADDDQDGDGFLLAEDCDDTSAAVNPAAGEVPQDGVDQDCDGVDATGGGGGGGGGGDADADADGWASEAYGGPDCDDADATRNPGATEARGDGTDSDCDGADFGASALSVGELVITEIMYDPDAVSDSDGEWFEVYVAAATSVNLRGLVVSDDAAYGAADLFTVEDDLVAAPGDRLVFAANDATSANGGISADYDYAGGGVSMNNSGDDLYLGASDGTRVTTIDAVRYDELAGWPLAKGVSIELKDTSVTASANDTASSWCLATRAAGSTTDKGSPGAVSSGC
jgi:hypothetical protein